MVNSLTRPHQNSNTPDFIAISNTIIVLSSTPAVPPVFTLLSS
jgi:hypothetical protein